MSEQVRVSVITPFLNVERFIEEAVDSVFAQTYTDWELLLIDDGSTDASTEIARRYAAQNPNRIRYLEHGGRVNRGISASMNLGIAEARGEYIAPLDADDVWLPTKLEEQVPILDAHSEVGIVYGNSLFWYSWTDLSKDGERDFLPDLGVRPATVIMPPDLLTRALQGAAELPCPSSILVRREVAQRVGGFEERFRAIFTDQGFYTKLFLATPAAVADGWRVKYRRHASSACAVMESSGEVGVRRLEFLEWARAYLEDNGMRGSDALRAIHREIQKRRSPRRAAVFSMVRRMRRKVTHAMKPIVRRLLPKRTARSATRGTPAPGRVRFGSLRRTFPINRHWGWERGQPIDRYYVEAFLETHVADIRGHVLEIGADTYTAGDQARHLGHQRRKFECDYCGGFGRCRSPSFGNIRLHCSHSDAPVHLRPSSRYPDCVSPPPPRWCATRNRAGNKPDNR